MTCPICDAPASRSSDNPHRPFCSKRCKLVDLSKWFGGEYSIAGSPAILDHGVPELADDDLGSGW